MAQENRKNRRYFTNIERGRSFLYGELAADGTTNRWARRESLRGAEGISIYCESCLACFSENDDDAMSSGTSLARKSERLLRP